MSDSGSYVLKNAEYEAHSDPYVIQQLAASALQTLITQYQAQLEPLAKEDGEESDTDTAAPELIDPMVLQLRDELEKLKAKREEALENAQVEATNLVAKAKTEGEHIKARAKEEAYQEGLAQGTEEGYEAGLKKGQEEGLRQWAELIARWESLLDSTLQQKDQYFKDREQILVKLVFETCAKILHREISSGKDVVTGLISQAIKRASERSKLLVHLNPEDISRAQEADAASFKRQEGIKQIEFLADETVVKGGVRIETDSETIDASLDLQLARIARKLMEAASDVD